jgi:hypothetical protein
MSVINPTLFRIIELLNVYVDVIVPKSPPAGNCPVRTSICAFAALAMSDRSTVLAAMLTHRFLLRNILEIALQHQNG